MVETVLLDSASDFSMQEILEMYEDALSPILNIRYLYSAMLERAILDLEMNVAFRDYEWFRDALLWFEGACHDPRGISYKDILSVLDLKAKDIRRIEERIEAGKKLHNRLLQTMRGKTVAFIKSEKYISKITGVG